jgi:L-iditol 2-dehydrogenase
MRAAVHAGTGEIRLETRPAPRIGSGELLLRVRGCGLCGSDLAKLRGPAPRPTVLGHEVVGEVAEAGAGAGDFRAGERVVVAHHVPCSACHYKRELTLTATYSSSPADLAEAFDLIRSGVVRVAELCSHRIPLERLAEAVGLMERREALKVFVEVGG